MSTQSGTAIPIANNILIDAFDSNENNDNGITTKGGAAAGDPPGTGAANEVSVYLTNRNTGTVTTTNATPTNVLTVSLGAVPGTYIAEGNLIAYNVTDTASGAYTFEGAARTSGAAGTELGIEGKGVWEDVAMTTADFNINIVGNNLIVEVIGIAGKVINWSAFFTYRFVG